jgi:succinate dehydrogenase / fumarate reductase membrane anchor subunit
VSTARRKVEGLGGAHHGAGTWIKERISALMLVPLGVWGLWSATRLIKAPFEDMIDWLKSPVNAVLLIALLLTAIYHMQLGLRVVIEDYVHKPFGKGTLLLLNLFVCLALAAAATFSILKIALGVDIGV